MHWTWQEAQDTAAAHANWHLRFDAAIEWSPWSEGGPASPIPDLTPSAHTMAPCCGAGWRGLVCTRLRGHTGRHAAGDGQHIVAVWGDPA